MHLLSALFWVEDKLESTTSKHISPIVGTDSNKDQYNEGSYMCYAENNWEYK